MIQIRMMTSADRNSVLEMMRVFYVSPAILSDGSEEIYRNDFEQCVGENPYVEGYIFENDGTTLGYAMVAKSFSTEFGKPCIWIEDLYMTESARGLGIGSRFLQYVEEKYPNCVLRLEVEANNERAIHVYKKSGFDVLPYIEMRK